MIDFVAPRQIGLRHHPVGNVELGVALRLHADTKQHFRPRTARFGEERIDQPEVVLTGLRLHLRPLNRDAHVLRAKSAEKRPQGLGAPLRPPRPVIGNVAGGAEERVFEEQILGVIAAEVDPELGVAERLHMRPAQAHEQPGQANEYDSRQHRSRSDENERPRNPPSRGSSRRSIGGRRGFIRGRARRGRCHWASVSPHPRPNQLFQK